LQFAGQLIQPLSLIYAFSTTLATCQPVSHNFIPLQVNSLTYTKTYANLRTQTTKGATMNGMMPVIRLELEGIKQSVASMFIDRNNELSNIVAETLDKTLSEEWIMKNIKSAVDECVTKAIASLSDSHALQYAIKCQIEECVIGSFSDKECDSNENS